MLSMHRLLIILLVTTFLFGCSSPSERKLSIADSSTRENAVDVGDYTFSLVLNDSSERNSLVSAELHYEGTEESVDIQHSSEILSYEVFDDDQQLIYSEYPTDAADQTTLNSGESTLKDLNVSLSDLPVPGEYTVVAVANFTDLSTNKEYEIENTLSFELE